MPLAIVKYKKGILNNDNAEGLACSLGLWAASALDCPDNPEARVNPKDVEVEVRVAGPLDRNGYDISITVEANLYPGRLADLESAQKQILAKLQRFLAQCRLHRLRCGVWVRLAPGSFGSFFSMPPL